MNKTPNGAMSSFAVVGRQDVKLRGSVRDYPPGPNPAGTYPIIGPNGEMHGTAACAPGKTTTVGCKDGKCGVVAD